MPASATDSARCGTAEFLNADAAQLAGIIHQPSNSESAEYDQESLRATPSIGTASESDSVDS